MTSTQPTSTPAKDVTARSETTLVSSQGKTTIAGTVVSKIAGIAAKEVNGVYSLGGGASRVVGALRERIPGRPPSTSTSSPTTEYPSPISRTGCAATSSQPSSG